MRDCFSLFHIFISFHHVLDCGLVSDLNISSILFQCNHSVHLKCLKIALAVSAIQTAYCWEQKSHFLNRSFNCMTPLTELGVILLFSWLCNNPKVLLPRALYGCRTSLSPKCLSICFFFLSFFPLTWSLEVQPSVSQSSFESRSPHGGLLYSFYSSVSSSPIKYDAFRISAEKVCNLHI